MSAVVTHEEQVREWIRRILDDVIAERAKAEGVTVEELLKKLQDQR